MSIPYLSHPTATIAAAGTTSATVDLREGRSLVGIYCDSALVGTALTFKASYDGVNFFAMNTTAGALSLTVAASKYVAVTPDNFLGVRFLQITSGSTETAGTTFTLAVRYTR